MSDENNIHQKKEFMDEIKTEHLAADVGMRDLKGRATLMASFTGVVLAAGTGFLASIHGDGSVFGIPVIGVLGGAAALLGGSLASYVMAAKTNIIMAPISSPRLSEIKNGKLKLSDRYYKITSKDTESYYELMTCAYLESLKSIETVNHKIGNRFNLGCGLFIAGAVALAGLALAMIGA